MKEQERVIKDFLQKMVDQDNRATAFPYFYVIRSEVEDSAPVDNCDYTKWYWQDGSYNSLAEITQSCKEMGWSEEETKAAKKEACEYGVKKRWEKIGMFLTETDAKEHLRLNHYHYSKNAHTYVAHAWRAPELSEFFANLFKHFQVEPSKKP